MSDATVRGAALVERLIAKLEADGGVLAGCGIPEHRAAGLPPDQLAALTLPDGRPLPPSLRRFLAYDQSYLGVLEGTPPRLRFRTLAAMLAEEFGPYAEDIGGGFMSLLPGPCLVVPGGSDSRRFLYAGEPDGDGEYPIFVVDLDDLPFVCLAYPGLDAYLADELGGETVMDRSYTDGFDHPTWAAALRDHAHRNFHGLRSFGLDGCDTEDADGRELDGDELAALLGG